MGVVKKIIAKRVGRLLSIALKEAYVPLTDASPIRFYSRMISRSIVMKLNHMPS